MGFSKNPTNFLFVNDKNHTAQKSHSNEYKELKRYINRNDHENKRLAAAYIIGKTCLESAPL